MNQICKKISLDSLSSYVIVHVTMVQYLRSKTQLSNIILHEKQAAIFYIADWAGPSRILQPIVARISQQFKSIAFYFIDADEHPDIVQAQDIESVPTCQLYANGLLVGFVKGPVPSELKARIQEFDECFQ